MIATVWNRSLLATAGVVTLLLGGLANPLRAQQAASSGLYGGSLFDRSTMTGDWGGARDALAAQGITVAPSFTQFYQGPTAGNTNHTFDYGDKADLFINIDGEKVGLWRGFSIQIHGEYNFGLTPGEVGGTSIPNNTAMSFPVQNQSGGDLSSVFFSQRFGPNFTIVAGKMNMFDFYASGHQFNGGRGIESFWNTAFVGPPSGTVPVSAFGMIASYKMDPLTFTGMVYDPHDALNRTGFEHPFSQGVTFRGSTDLSSKLLGLPRTDGLAFAVSSEKGTDFSSLPYANSLTAPAFSRVLARDFLTEGLFGERSTIPTEKSGRFWVGYSFEQTVWRSLANPTKSWGLFGQTAMSDGNPNSLQWSVLGGIGGTSPLSGRADDKFGVGFFYYGYSNELKSHLEPVVQLGDEYGAEVFYNFAITKWFKVTADAQAIAPAVKAQIETPLTRNPTVVNNSTVLLLGLRTQITF